MTMQTTALAPAERAVRLLGGDLTERSLRQHLEGLSGVDAVGLGHRDYAMDAGLPDFDYFQAGMQQALHAINDAARRHRKAYFGSGGTAEELRRQIGEGAQIFTLVRDTGVWKARCAAARALADEAGGVSQGS